MDGVTIRAIRAPRSRVGRFLITPVSLFIRAVRLRASVYQINETALLPLAFVLKLIGRRVVYDVLEDTPGQLKFKTWLPRPLRAMSGFCVGRMERLAARILDGLIFAGDNIAQRLAPLGHRSIVIHNYPHKKDFSHWSLSPLVQWRTRNTIVNLGGISAARVTESLVRAMAFVPESYGIRLLIGGRIADQGYFESVRQLLDWRKVEFYGAMPFSDAKRIMREAALGIVMFSREPNHYEVRANRLFETMAAGVPVLVSNFPDWRKVVVDPGYGLCADPDSPEQIAAAIIEVFDNPERSRQMGAKAREAFTAQYNWDREERAYIEFMERIINGAPDGHPC